MLLVERLQLSDPPTGFCSLVTKLTGILHGLVEFLVALGSWGATAACACHPNGSTSDLRDGALVEDALD
jgi:hypothetical protein